LAGEGDLLGDLELPRLGERDPLGDRELTLLGERELPLLGDCELTLFGERERELRCGEGEPALLGDREFLCGDLERLGDLSSL